MPEIHFESALLTSPAVYDEQKQIITLEFRGGQKYNYQDFTPQDWAEFAAAESKGKHFLRVIKPKFVCTKLPPEEKTSAEETGNN
jgi:KTSC domain